MAFRAFGVAVGAFGVALDDVFAAHAQLTREEHSAAVAFAIDAVRLERLGVLRPRS